MKIVMHLLALIAGTVLSVEGAIYAELGKNKSFMDRDWCMFL